MTILYYVIMLLHVAACVFLISVVLLQQGKGQDLASAFGGGGTQTAFGPRGSATVLTRATTILAGLFMVTSLTLSLVRPKEASVLDALPQTAEPAAAPDSGSDVVPGAGSDSEAQPAPGSSPEAGALDAGATDQAPAAEGAAAPAPGDSPAPEATPEG